MRRLALVAVLTIIPTVASATDICEDTPITYSARAVSASAGLLLVDGLMAWCTKTGSTPPGEKRGKLRFAAVRSLGGVTRAWFVDRTTARLRAEFRRRLRARAQRPLASLAAYKKRLGFQPLARFRVSPRGCYARVDKVADKAKAGSFASSTIRLLVFARGERKKPLLARRLGHADDEAGHSVLTAFVSKRDGVVAWVDLGRCAGPPPGYFGSEDPGTCYKTHAPRLLRLGTTVGSRLALARCF
ncbi:MAG: hypothetical protein KC503_05785 [Myxococcales bacterium]|nr:hypothetical protein [Myxococcales bacterium]